MFEASESLKSRFELLLPLSIQMDRVSGIIQCSVSGRSLILVPDENYNQYPAGY